MCDGDPACKGWTATRAYAHASDYKCMLMTSWATGHPKVRPLSPLHYRRRHCRRRRHRPSYSYFYSYFPPPLLPPPPLPSLPTTAATAATAYVFHRRTAPPSAPSATTSSRPASALARVQCLRHHCDQVDSHFFLFFSPLASTNAVTSHSLRQYHRTTHRTTQCTNAVTTVPDRVVGPPHAARVILIGGGSRWFGALLTALCPKWGFRPALGGQPQHPCPRP